MKEKYWISPKERLPKTFPFLANCSSQVWVHFWLDSLIADNYGETRKYECDSMGYYSADGKWYAMVGMDDKIGRYDYREVEVEFWSPIPYPSRKMNKDNC